MKKMSLVLSIGLSLATLTLSGCSILSEPADPVGTWSTGELSVETIGSTAWAAIYKDGRILAADECGGKAYGNWEVKSGKVDVILQGTIPGSADGCESSWLGTLDSISTTDSSIELKDSDSNSLKEMSLNSRDASIADNLMSEAVMKRGAEIAKGIQGVNGEPGEDTSYSSRFGND